MTILSALKIHMLTWIVLELAISHGSARWVVVIVQIWGLLSKVFLRYSARTPKKTAFYKITLFL